MLKRFIAYGLALLLAAPAYALDPTPGSGSLVSPTGQDARYDLSSSDPSALTSSNMGVTALLRNTRFGAKLTLPSATTLSGKTRGLGIALGDAQAPVAIFNAGTVGTDPVLEKVIGPGASGRIDASDISSAAGKWTWHGSGLLKGYPWPSNALPVTKTLGATAVGTMVQTHPQMVMLSSTMAAYVMADSSNNIQLYAISLNADGSVNAVSAATQLRSGATNAMRNPTIVKVNSSGKVVASWWDNTNSKTEFVAVTITAGNPPTIGTPGTVIDDSSITANDRIGSGQSALIQDGTDALWANGQMAVTTGLDIYHLTLSGTTITLNTNSKQTSWSAGATYGRGYSTSTGNMLVVGISSTANIHQANLVNYSGGVISVTWSTALNTTTTPFGSTANPELIPIDATNGIFASLFNDNVRSGVVVFKVDLSAGTLYWSYVVSIFFPYNSTVGMGTTDEGPAAAGAFLSLGDGEFAYVFNADANPYRRFYYLDLKSNLISGLNTTTAGQSPSIGFAELKEYPLIGALGSPATTMAGALAWESTTRRLLIMGVPKPNSGNWLMYFNTVQLPRR